MATKKKTWIRVSTAARLRGVSRQAIYWHVHEGNLETMELDGVVYVNKEQVLNWKRKGEGEYRPREKSET